MTPFRVLVVAESGGHHIEYSKRAAVWLDELAKEKGFIVDTIHDTNPIDEAFLEKYKLFIQLDYPPYAWKPKAVAAFERYIEQGRGGWIGFHHASLLGEFDGYPMWDWFHRFMGGIRFNDYIATFAQAEVRVEDPEHPIMEGVPASFVVEREEWYTYDQNPRPNVHVLARVDESTYRPESDVKMGDHPVAWTNPRMKARNAYIFMGHGPDLFDNPAYTRLFQNAILWTAGRD
ncbi:hypothetical protein BH11ARM2_BH11ARM2_35100 [soil metagenome]